MSKEPSDRDTAAFNLGQAFQTIHDGNLIEAARLALLAAELLIEGEKSRLSTEQKDELQRQMISICCLLDPKLSARMLKAEAAKLAKKAKRDEEHIKERAERKEGSKIAGHSRSSAIKGAQASVIYGVVTGLSASKSKRAVSRALSRVHKIPTETILSIVKRGQKKLGSKPKK